MDGPSTGKKLRLRAVDYEDLAVFSAVLQDARAPLREMAFDPDERRFLAAFNRCCRERDEADTNCLAVLRVEGVRTVNHRGLITSDMDRVHHLVLILQEPEPAPKDGVYLTLVFRDGSAIRLEVDAVDCRLEDLDDLASAAEAN